MPKKSRGENEYVNLVFYLCSGSDFGIANSFLVVEHQKLQRKYGGKKGTKIGNILGTISGEMEFIFLIGLWVSPQPRFTVHVLSGSSISIPFVDFSIPIIHLIIALPFVLTGAWLAIKAVKVVSLKIAETHGKPSKIMTSGPYSVARHPQYLGANLVQIGMSFLFSAGHSLLFIPVYIFLQLSGYMESGEGAGQGVWWRI
jgi:protein-S-isoprenylcysteine O-methyltransferase Ste14